MPAVLVLHDVDDVEHWLSSGRRQELLGPRGFTVRTFVDPADPSRVGLIIEGAGASEFQEVMESSAAADAVKHDGVRADTVRVLEERQGGHGLRARAGR